MGANNSCRINHRSNSINKKMIIKKHKNDILNILVTMYCLIVVLFSISLVSPTAMIGQMPDICIPYNQQFTNIWLDSYYSIDNDDVIHIYYRDPDLGRLTYIPIGYNTGHETCWDMAYYESFGKDLLRIESMNEDCNRDIEIKFPNEQGMDQTFNMDIRNDCTDNVDPDPVYVDLSDPMFDHLISFFSFDDTLQDSKFNYDFRNFTTTTYSTMAKHGKSINLKQFKGDFNRTSSVLSTDFSFSYWLNDTPEIDGIDYFLICNGYNIAHYTDSSNDPDHVACMEAQPCNSGNLTGLSDSTFHHFMFIKDGSTMELYVDNSLKQSKSVSGITIDHCTFGDNIINDYDILLDDLAIFNKSLNSTERADLYNSGNGYDFSENETLYTPQSSEVADIVMDQHSTAWIYLPDYFSDNWDYMYYQAPNPFNNDQLLNMISLETGQNTTRLPIWTNTNHFDYYDLRLESNGSLNITSYGRPYFFTITVSACTNAYFEECKEESFTISIGGTLSEVEAMGTMEAYYNLNFTGRKLFSMARWFRYHTDTLFSFPDSNQTGVLNGSYSYANIENPLRGANYMVMLTCDIDQTYETYNFLGDLNISVECGNGNAWYDVRPHKTYHQHVSFVGNNSISTAYHNTTILAGDFDLPSEHQTAETTSSTTALNNSVLSFSNLLPQSISDQNKTRLVFFILIIIVGVIFSALYKYSVPLAFYISLVASVFILFVFVSADYISPAYPILLLFILISGLIIKFIRGGG